jgi:serine/threonine protein phosphatase PrpC
LGVLLHGQDLYTLNVGDSRAILATSHPPENSISSDQVDGGSLWAVQMTESHAVDNVDENNRILSEHPDDPGAISGGRLKGKLKVTRAFGAGYLKHAKMNNALMGILRVRNLFSPPYLGVTPCVSAHRVSDDDSFVVLGSDGLFDFFTNDEVVSHVHNFVQENPAGDPAKYMLEQLLLRAAENAGMSVDQLKEIPIGRRRKYHDDVTIIVISLGAQFPTSTASTIVN